LARGLVSSEYWELVSFVLIDGLEEAKQSLESSGTDDRTLRVRQGEALAYRAAFNSMLELGKDIKEISDGE
jgi:hypothetical protein